MAEPAGRPGLRTAALAAAGLAAAALLSACSEGLRPPWERPNIVMILADDLGYGDLGVYGQQVIATPQLDRLAREGMVFTDFYAGSTVCAPSRSVLMTGLHTGHTTVRGNSDPVTQSLRAEDVTVAEVLKAAGYATGLFGKWGLGEQGLPGHPLDQGFDAFYGYLNQVHAHNYYPEFLWRGREREPLRNVVERAEERPSGRFTGGWAVEKHDYSHDLIVEEALAWLDANRERPFFLYLALTIPHANNEATRATGDGQEVPDYGAYAGRDWPDPDKGQAAMISRMDRDVGRLVDRLREHGIDRNTLVLFSSDNGPHDEGGHDVTRFAPAGPLRGMKRDLYEGGIRVPFVAWWPGRVKAGSICRRPGYFGDLMPTAAELAGAEAPAPLDGESLLPALEGRAADEPHPHLYWEFYERGGKQALRMGDWKGVRFGIGSGPIELYDLSRDLGESRDVAAEHPEVVAAIEAAMAAAHVPDPRWTPRGEPREPQPAPGSGVPVFPAPESAAE